MIQSPLKDVDDGDSDDVVVDSGDVAAIDQSSKKLIYLVLQRETLKKRVPQKNDVVHFW